MPEVGPGKFLVTAGWQDVPHLDQQTQQELLASTPPYLRAARSKGEPSLGAGAIYPIPVDEIIVDPFPIPAWWPRVYGLDVGWKRTAAVWLAWDRENDLLYGYTEHYRGQAEPSIHANAIRARGDWIPGVIDPAARGRQQADGQQLITSYRELGLKLTPADNAVEAGIYEVWERLSTGRLKLFKTMQNLLAEYRLYRRDEKGKIVKEFDHCLHPDTRVHTDRGLIPIRELVGTEGRVLTLGGRWADYRNCRLTARSQRVVRVTFSDGSSVICTPDHRFMTPNGWVQAVDLRGSVLNAAADSEQTNTPASSPAARSVLLLCQRVEDAGVSDVYCLTVPETEAFAVEGGVIVHNCMDALRYAVMSGRAVAAVQPAMRDQSGRGSAAAGDSTAGY